MILISRQRLKKLQAYEALETLYKTSHEAIISAIHDLFDPAPPVLYDDGRKHTGLLEEDDFVLPIVDDPWEDK